MSNKKKIYIYYRKSVHHENWTKTVFAIANDSVRKKTAEQFEFLIKRTTLRLLIITWAGRRCSYATCAIKCVRMPEDSGVIVACTGKGRGGVSGETDENKINLQIRV